LLFWEKNPKNLKKKNFRFQVLLFKMIPITFYLLSYYVT
jgi:hypothetical protein